MDKSLAERALKLIVRGGWLADRDPLLAAAIVKAGRFVRMNAGQWTHGEGDAETGLVLVLEGAVQLYSKAPGDREVLLAHIEPGNVFGQTVRFGGGPRLVTAICAKPSQLLIVSDRALTQISATWPQIWQAVAALAYQQLRRMTQAVAELLALPPKQRLAGRLLAQAMPNFGRNAMTLHISQQSLGELVGLTRKTVNALLAGFERQGLVKRHYGRLELLDIKGLRRVCES
jgi:CRP-like cAMP-binding protein